MRSRARARRAEPAPFPFGDKEVQPASLERFEVPVARLPSGAWMSFVVVVLHGANPGPVAWLSAGIHGDELDGPVIVDEVVRRLAGRLRRLSGTVLAVPVVNGIGFSTSSRYLPDGRDLNRSFPGSRRGSLAAQLAHLFVDRVVRHSSLGIDFHSGARGRSNLPQLRCDVRDPETLRLAQAFGVKLLLASALKDGSLRAWAVSTGRRVLLYEGGQNEQLESTAIEQGVRGALATLAAYGMLPERARQAQRPPLVYTKSRWVRATRSGLARPAVTLGSHVKKGDLLATILDPSFGRRTELRSPRAGCVIGQLARTLVHRGDAVVHLAEAASLVTPEALSRRE